MIPPATLERWAEMAKHNKDSNVFQGHQVAALIDEIRRLRKELDDEFKEGQAAVRYAVEHERQQSAERGTFGGGYGY
jgi:hypothetical protein